MVSYLFFSSYNSAKLGNNMMSTCSFGLFQPDGGQKMAWLQVNSGTLSLRPYPHVSLFFENENFFLCFQKKKSVSRGCVFFSVTENGTIFDGSNACVFTGIQHQEINLHYTGVQLNSVFKNILSGKLFERMHFRRHFSPDMCGWQAKPKEKILVFKQKWTRVERP